MLRGCEDCDRFELIPICRLNFIIDRLHGAAMGTTALLSGFVVDAITAVIGAAYIKWVRV